MPVLVDATVLTNFAAIDRLDLLREYVEDGRITHAVYDEVQRGIAAGFAFLQRVEEHLNPPHDDGWLRLIDLESEEERTFFERIPDWLKAGEATSLAISRHRGWDFYTDDRRARRFADELGITISGTLGVLVGLVEAGSLTIESANELLVEMVRIARYRSPVTDLRDLGLTDTGEME
jgi:predicted nucleic acid-binding protein